MRIRRNAQLKPATTHLVLFKSTMAGCYSACLQLYCRAQRASVPNLFIQGSQVLHQPTCILHLQNVSSVLSPKNGPSPPLIIYSNTCQQRISRLSSDRKRFLWENSSLVIFLRKTHKKRGDGMVPGGSFWI